MQNILHITQAQIAESKAECTVPLYLNPSIRTNIFYTFESTFDLHEHPFFLRTVDRKSAYFLLQLTATTCSVCSGNMGVCCPAIYPEIFASGRSSI